MHTLHTEAASIPLITHLSRWRPWSLSLSKPDKRLFHPGLSPALESMRCSHRVIFNPPWVRGDPERPVPGNPQITSLPAQVGGRVTGRHAARRLRTVSPAQSWGPGSSPYFANPGALLGKVKTPRSSHASFLNSGCRSCRVDSEKPPNLCCFWEEKACPRAAFVSCLCSSKPECVRGVSKPV